MRVFLSYSSEDRKLVEPIYLSLRAQGHTVFFDRADLPPGEEYDARIREAIEKSQLFVFMLSPDSLKSGSYTLTELSIAQKTWEYPGGRLLPVVLALSRRQPQFVHRYGTTCTRGSVNARTKRLVFLGARPQSPGRKIRLATRTASRC